MPTIALCVVLKLLAAAAPGALPLRAATLTVRIVDTANQPLRNAYVAVVRNDAPWHEPAMERLADEKTQFDLPAGVYRIVAGTPGFVTYFGDAIQLDESREATVHLVRLGSVAGRVAGAGGGPLAGARVGMFWEFLADHPHRLSALGQRHLRGNTLAVSDGDGIFELPMQVGRSTFVVVEADRKTPRIVEGVTAGSALLQNVELQDGGALDLHVAGPVRAGSFRLVPAKGETLASLPLERALTLWMRPAAAVVEWRSLPAMTFSLLFEPDDWPGEIEVLKDVAIARGAKQVAEVALPPATELAAAPRRTVRFLVSDVGNDRLTVKRWTAAGATPLPVRLRHVSGGTMAEVDTPCAAGDRITFESAHFAGGVLASGDCSGTPSVALHPRATLHWTMTAPRPEHLPATGKASISDCETHHFVVEMPFVIAPNGAATLPVPAQCISVRATAGTFSPIEWPRLELTAGAERDLGAVALSTAATLYVRIFAADGRPAGGVAVSAARVDDLVPLRNVLDVAAVAPVARGITDAKGWVALNAIPAARIVLVLRRAGVDYPQLSDVVRVTGDGRRTVDVTLEEPGRVAVTVERPRDLPALTVSSFEILPLPDNRWPHALAFRARPAADGTASFGAVPPGRWRVSVLGTAGESTLMTLASAEIAVTPGAFVAQSIAIEAVAVRGRVTRNGTPVQGVLTLRPAGAAAQAPLTTTLDADGAFTLLAPAAGDYRAVVAEPGKQTTAARAPVHVARNAVDVDIALPSGKIEGRVVGPDGNGVVGAMVGAVSRANDTASYDIAEAHAVSRGDGSFAIDGVRDGQWSLTASTERLASEPLAITLGDGEIRGGATLRLRPKTMVSGTLVAADGTPLAGAAVSAILPPPFSDIAAGLVVRTDANGQFTLSPPPGVPDVANIVVRTADRVAMAARMRIEEGMKISLPPSLGALRITNASGKWNRDAIAFHALVAADGSYLNPSAGGSIAAEGGREVLSTARIPAQQYRYVVARTPQERALLQSGSGAMLPALRTITVQANNVVEVDLGDLQ